MSSCRLSYCAPGIINRNGAMLHYLLNFLYPPRRAVCGVGLPIDTTRRGGPACRGRVWPLGAVLRILCGASLDTADENQRCHRCGIAPPAFDSARAITRYRSGADGSSTIAALLRRHKYGLDQSLGSALAEYLDAAPP